MKHEELEMKTKELVKNILVSWYGRSGVEPHDLEKEVYDEMIAEMEEKTKATLQKKLQYSGRAIVKSSSDDQPWRYEGLELKIIGIGCIYHNGYGVYPDGTREFKLCLKGTQWEDEQTYTVIPETDLEILELKKELL